MALTGESSSSPSITLRFEDLHVCRNWPTWIFVFGM